MKTVSRRSMTLGRTRHDVEGRPHNRLSQRVKIISHAEIFSGGCDGWFRSQGGLPDSEFGTMAARNLLFV